MRIQGIQWGYSEYTSEIQREYSGDTLRIQCGYSRKREEEEGGGGGEGSTKPISSFSRSSLELCCYVKCYENNDFNRPVIIFSHLVSSNWSVINKHYF